MAPWHPHLWYFGSSLYRAGDAGTAWASKVLVGAKSDSFADRGSVLCGLDSLPIQIANRIHAGQRLRRRRLSTQPHSPSHVDMAVMTMRKSSSRARPVIIDDLMARTA